MILLIGVAVTFVAPTSARWVGLVALTISLAGSLIGLFLALRGVGPNTMPDIVYHFALVALLLIGLAVGWRVDGDPMHRARSTR